MVSNMLVLKREVESECYECLATIRVKEKRSYLTTVLKLAKKNGVIDENLIIKELLPGESIKMARNLISRYEQLGFLDENGSLTDLGEEAANGNVFMPERGKYLICVSPDPTIVSGLVEIKSLDDRTAVKENKQNYNKNKSSDEEIPEILENCVGNRSLVWFNDNIEEVWIDEISNSVIKGEQIQKFKVEITVSYNGLHMKLLRNKSEMILTPSNIVSLEDVWESFRYSNKLNWQGWPLQKGVNLVEYKELEMKNIKSFTRIIPSFKLNLEDMGAFDTDPVEVNIQPVSQEDASKWALDLITIDLVDYIDEKIFGQIVKNVKSKFTSYHPKMPKLKEFMKYIYEKALQSDKDIPMEYWYLRAPIDLVLEGN